MFLKLRSEPKKNKQTNKNIYIYVHTQVIQNCTFLSRVDLKYVRKRTGYKTKKMKTREALCSDVL